MPKCDITGSIQACVPEVFVNKAQHRALEGFGFTAELFPYAFAGRPYALLQRPEQRLIVMRRVVGRQRHFLAKRLG